MEIKVVVCGDSFCSSHNYERNHFSQILEDKYGYLVTNLARGGTGPIAVCFQLQQAIKLSADVIVYRRVDTGRIEVPITGQPFDPELGLKNFKYPYPDETSYSSPYVGNVDAPFFSSGLGGLVPQTDPKEQQLQDRFFAISSELREAVKQYLLFMFDKNLKAETDNWAYGYWEYRALQNNIKVISFDQVGQIAYEFSKRTQHRYPTVYHTDRPTQETIAENIHQEIQQHRG